MAENSLSLSNLEGIQPSISQENKQVTNDLTLSNLEGVKDIVVDDKKELSISILEMYFVLLKQVFKQHLTLIKNLKK